MEFNLLVASVSAGNNYTTDLDVSERLQEAIDRGDSWTDPNGNVVALTAFVKVVLTTPAPTNPTTAPPECEYFFHITGPLWGESTGEQWILVTGDQWILLHKGSVMWSAMLSVKLSEFASENVLNLWLCNSATVWHSPLKFGHMWLCNIHYKKFKLIWCKCTSLGDIEAINCDNTCHGPHMSSLWSSCKHNMISPGCCEIPLQRSLCVYAQPMRDDVTM